MYSKFVACFCVARELFHWNALALRASLDDRMAEPQLKAFLEAIKLDADLQKKVQMASSPKAIAAIAHSAGFVISEEDLNLADQIGDQELKDVSGGSGQPFGA